MTTGSLNPIRRTPGGTSAVLFVHGFSGNRDDTWDRFPALLGMEVPDWDIFMLGYATTFLPDVVGIWSADPDIPIISTMFRTEAGIAPLAHYDRIAIVAHSMGGLVVQRALVDDPELARRVRHLVMFGTPSDGLRKASWAAFWKRQLRNMASGSDFVRTLRTEWTGRFGATPSFHLTVVAGAKDQFVPPESSLHPFDRGFWRVVPGDHLSMVKPDDPSSESVRLLKAVLETPEAPTVAAMAASPAPASPELRIAAEQATAGVADIIRAKGDTLSEPEVVDAALALERDGKQPESIALLERYQHLGTDVRGTLAGRIKRLWLQNEDPALAQRALELYEGALAKALEKDDSEQVYYHAINVAFLRFVAFGDLTDAQNHAKLALQHCERSKRNVWNIATQAEAQLYLGDVPRARELYRQLALEPAQPWQLSSASQQAGRIALELRQGGRAATQAGVEALANDLEAMFTPAAQRCNKIFVSYSHSDKDWVDRLQMMMAPYLRQDGSELTLWVDQQIEPGDRWFTEIKQALASAGVAVVLVSRAFLASPFVTTHELPQIIQGAKDGTLKLLWVYVSPAALDATNLGDFQAAYDPKMPLAKLAPVDQEQALLEIAQAIKQAALGATKRFTS